MNLFGGSENYVFNGFSLLDKGKNPNKQRLFITLKKVHKTKEVIEFSDSVEEPYIKVFDNYQPVSKTIELYVEGVGRFNIEPEPFKVASFEFFKKIVKELHFFELSVNIDLPLYIDNDRGKIEFTDNALRFETDNSSASFKVN